MASAPELSNGPNRLGPVEGYLERKNEIVYHPSELRVPVGIVVFFGGDMQDYKENMLAHRDNKYYSEWDLESTTVLLHNHFPNYAIVSIKPSIMSLKTFSCYKNFVEVNNFGAPSYSVCPDSLIHLKLLLKNVSNILKVEFTDITLIGFSKGCVVLNQLLYSFHSLKEHNDEELVSFLNNIHNMYWIDGGHSGTSPTWVTKKSVLESFSNLSINVHIHVTPYQVHCDTRPRIGKEEKIFRETLCKMGVDVKRKLHFDSEPRSLEFHFKVLKYFHNAE